MNYQNILNSKIRVVSSVLWAGQEGKKERLLHASVIPRWASIYCADIWGSGCIEVAGAKSAEESTVNWEHTLQLPTRAAAAGTAAPAAEPLGTNWKRVLRALGLELAQDRQQTPHSPLASLYTCFVPTCGAALVGHASQRWQEWTLQ